MKRFLSNLLLLALITTTIYLGWYVACNVRNVKAVVKVLDCEVISPCNSHEQCAIDPEIFKQYGNLNSIATPPWLWEAKLRLLLATGKCHPKILLIDRGDHEILFGGNPDSIAQVVARFLPLYALYPTCPYAFNWGDVLHYFAGSRPFIVVWAEKPPKVMRPKGSSIDIDFRLKDHFGSFTGVVDEDSVQKFVSVLENMVELALSHDIEPILLTTPKHAEYLKGVPAAIAKENELINDKLIRKYGIRHLDYSKSDYDEECFGDADHLSGKGCERFTHQLMKDLGYED